MEKPPVACNFFALKSQTPAIAFPDCLLNCGFIHLTDQLNDTASSLDLLLGESRDVACLDNDGNFGESALSEDLGVTEREEVDDGGDIAGGLGKVLLARLGGDKSPEL
jgi:hypothetical protein